MKSLVRIVALIVAAVCFVVVLFFDPKQGTTLGPAELLAVGSIALIVALVVPGLD